MCRWLAYSGPPTLLGDVLVRPDHSLLDQSSRATQNIQTTNGDGFGVGWYGVGNTAGIYRDTHPAWNDANFRHLCDHVQSGLFFAHVRAATGTPVQNTNCHPFTFDNWMFQHNGSVPGFRKLKRQLMFDVDPELFPFIEGSTDSETLFYLALTLGLRDDPPSALSRMIAHVERVKGAAGIQGQIRFSACVSDGIRIWSVRYATPNGPLPPTQYYSNHIHALKAIDGTYQPLADNSVIVLSEPLDELTEHWKEVPSSSILTVKDGQVTITPFTPE